MEGLLKVILVRAKKEKRRGIEKFSVFLEKTYAITYRLVEIWTLRVILMRCQMAMRNVSLETGRRALIVTKWQRILNRVHVLAFWKGGTSDQRKWMFS